MPETIRLFSTIKRNTLSDDTFTCLVHNVKSLSEHVDDIVSDDRIINNYIIGFTETQIIPSDSNCKITETLNFFNFNFNTKKMFTFNLQI